MQAKPRLNSSSIPDPGARTVRDAGKRPDAALGEELERALGLSSRKTSRYFPAVAITVAFLAITLAAYLAVDRSQPLFAVYRYLYLLPILWAGYRYGRDGALMVSLASTALFTPRLVDLLVQARAPEATSELFFSAAELMALLLFYNLFGLLGAALVEFDRRHRKLLDTVDQLGEVIEKSLDLESLLTLVLHHSALISDAEGAEIVLRGDGQEETVHANVGRPLVNGAESWTAPNGHRSLAEWLAQQESPMILADLENDPRFVLPPSHPHRRTSLLAVPLRQGGRPMGMLALWRSGDNVFGKEEMELLKVLADKSQMAIENARLHSRTSEALSSLLEVSTDFASIADLDQVFQTLCEHLVEAVDATCGRVLQLEGETLVVRAAHAAQPGLADTIRGESVAKTQVPWLLQAMKADAPILLQRRAMRSRLDQEEYRFLFKDQEEELLIVPVAVQRHAIGVAILGRHAAVPSASLADEAKVELCQAIARQGALAVENIRAVESIAREGQRIRLIMDNVTDGVFSTDLEGHILAFNPAAEVITGYRQAEALGRHYAELLAGGSEEVQLWDGDGLLQRVLHSEASTAIHRKTWIMRQDGERIRIAHSMAPLIDQHSQIIGTVSVIRDVSREEELIRLKSEFISLVSHQLRTPLTSISASAELLDDDSLAPGSRAKLVRTLVQQTSRLQRLVNQVLEASRLETGEIKLMLEPLALAPLLEGTVQIHRAQHPEHRFQLKLPPKPLIVLGDRESLEIILDNLLQNAVNYSQPGSTVTVQVADGEEEAIISVADQGVGIPEEHRAQIFERFRRLPGSERGTGFGLGLHITKMLVEQQGGRIWVESEIGQGSCFYFTMRKLGDIDE